MGDGGLGEEFSPSQSCTHRPPRFKDLCSHEKVIDKAKSSDECR